MLIKLRTLAVQSYLLLTHIVAIMLKNFDQNLLTFDVTLALCDSAPQLI